MSEKQNRRNKCPLRGRVPDILLVEPSACDRQQNATLEELTERCWLLSRPPPALYDREPTITARRAEVVRFSIAGDGADPVMVPAPIDTCALELTHGQVHETRRSTETSVSPRERLRSIERQSLYL